MNDRWIAYHERKLDAQRQGDYDTAIVEILTCLLESPGITEPKLIVWVQHNTGLRPLVVASGLRLLLYRERIKREGKGRRGSPFRYYFS